MAKWFMFLSRRITVLFFCLLCSLIQPATADSIRKVTPAQWEQLKADKAFSYKNDKEFIKRPEESKPGILQQLLSALFTFRGSGIGNTILWILLICVVIYIVYRLFLTKGSFVFGRNKKMMNEAGPPEEGEDISTTNWEMLLQQAIGGNDTRLAIRYTYMWLLQLLQEHELIRYRNDKTNYEYYTELNGTIYKKLFQQLSRQYEYAWYGHYSIPAAAYDDYAALFNNLKNQLGR
jgi:hypothetical protein